MSEDFSIIGKSVRQKDGVERVTGQAKFFGDVMLLNMLHTKILRCPYAQADIITIDTTAAQALPGVALVMTFENYPKIFRKDLHYVGDEVAAVIAVDEEKADEALDLIEVAYEPKPFVLNIREAMKENAPRVFPDRPNIRPGWGPKGTKWLYFSEKDRETGLWTKKEESDFHGFGNVKKGFPEADIIVEDSDISLGYSRVTTMEPRGCVASFENELLTVWTHSQGLHNAKNEIAQCFGLPTNKVNLVSPYTGGSFGGKRDRFDIPIAASMALGQPVKLVYTREEEMLRGWSRGSLSKIKLGLKNDGTLTTMEIEHWVEVGPDGDSYPIRNVFRNTGAMLYSHNCEHLKITAGVVFTNRFVSIGWRGYGCPESNFMVETVMDEAAHRLGMDPVDLRRKNHFRKGDPVASPRDVLVHAQISSSGIAECLDQGVEKVAWRNTWQHPKEKNQIVREGMGMALTIHGSGDGLYSTAIVKVLRDATVIFECSIADMGQGQHTVQSQIVAEVLGVPYENIHIVCHDTNSTPFTVTLTGSQGTWHQGKATFEAASSAKQQILALASRKLGASPENLTVRNTIISITGTAEKSCTFDEALGDIPMIIGVGQTFPDGREEGVYPHEQGAHFAQCAVDTETGGIKLLTYVAAPYIGRALNPKVVEGQVAGGVYQGLESALFGECIVDPQTGKMLTYNWENYKPITMLDFPIEPMLVEIPDRDHSHPFGATACGEGSTDPICAVIGNALYNSLGIRLKSTPFTPDKILKALGKI